MRQTTDEGAQWQALPVCIAAQAIACVPMDVLARIAAVVEGLTVGAFNIKRALWW